MLWTNVKIQLSKLPQFHLLSREFILNDAMTIQNPRDTRSLLVTCISNNESRIFANAENPMTHCKDNAIFSAESLSSCSRRNSFHYFRAECQATGEGGEKRDDFSPRWIMHGSERCSRERHYSRRIPKEIRKGRANAASRALRHGQSQM